jgi:hypothetical protein
MSVGALALPVPVAAEGETAGDPLIDTLLSFFKAVLPAQAGQAWAEIAPGRPIVGATYPWDPMTSFLDTALPALHLWRSEVQKPVLLGQGLRVRPSTLMLNWVFPNDAQHKQRIRDPFLNVIAAVVNDVVEQYGRHPSWVVTGDTDPVAADRGSLLWSYAKVFRFEAGRARHTRLDIPLYDVGARPKSYQRIELEISVQEELMPNLALWDEMGGVDLTARSGVSAALPDTAVENEANFRP